MPDIIRLKLNFDKIDTKTLFKGKNGQMLDITLLPRRDAYGNDYMVVQDLGKDRRLKGEKGPILGNGKTMEAPGQRREPAAEPEPEVYNDMKQPPARPAAAPTPGTANLDEDVPF